MSLKLFLLNTISLLSIFIGLFLFIGTIINPNKLLSLNLINDNSTNIKSFIFCKKILFLLLGILLIINGLLFLFNIITPVTFGLLLAIIACITQIGNLIISKIYLN